MSLRARQNGGGKVRNGGGGRGAGNGSPAGRGNNSGDPYFSFVKLLLHMDGADGGSTFTDSSSLGHSIIATNMGTETEVVKFGTAAAYSGVLVANTTTKLGVADTTQLELAAQDFCIECWLYWDTTVSNGNWSPVISDKTAASNLEHRFGIVGGAAGAATLQFYYSTTGADFTGLSSASFTPGTGSWGHYAVSRSGSSLRFWVNGIQSGATQTLSSTIFSGTAAWRNVTPGTSSTTWTGRMDDLRITIGQARYTSNFAVPTSAFPNS